MNKFVKDKILFNMERVNVIPSRTFSVILFFCDNLYNNGCVHLVRQIGFASFCLAHFEFFLPILFKRTNKGLFLHNTLYANQHLVYAIQTFFRH